MDEREAALFPPLWQDDWGSLRKAMQRLVSAVGEVEPKAPSGSEPRPPELADPQWIDDRRAELDGWEKAVRAAEFDLEGRLKATEHAWRQLEADLENRLKSLRAVAEIGFEEFTLKGIPPDDARLAQMEAQSVEMQAIWARLQRHERKARVDKAWLAKTWRWLREVSLPALETRCRGGPLEPRVVALRARVSRMDRFWTGFQAQEPAMAAEGLELQIAKAVAAEIKRVKGRLEEHIRLKRERDNAADHAAARNAADEAAEMRLRLEAAEAARESAERLLAATRAKSAKDVARLERMNVEFERAFLDTLASAERLADENTHVRRAMADLRAESALVDAGKRKSPVAGESWTLWPRFLAWIEGELAKASAAMRQGRPSALWATLGALQDVLKSAAHLDREPPAALPASLAPVVDAALRMWSTPFRARRIVVTRNWAPELPACMLAPEALSVALYQLLRNAYEAMPRGGTLSLDISLDESTRQVVLRVADQGPGLPDAILQDPFIPCASPRPGHPGLGLALVGRILSGIGGSVELSNQPQKGALVVLRFAPAETIPPLSPAP